MSSMEEELGDADSPSPSSSSIEDAEMVRRAAVSETVRRAALHTGTVTGELLALQATFGDNRTGLDDVDTFAQEETKQALRWAFAKVETAWYFLEKPKFLVRVEKIADDPAAPAPRKQLATVVDRKRGLVGPAKRNAYVEDGCKMDLRARLSQLPLEMAKAVVMNLPEMWNFSSPVVRSDRRVAVRSLNPHTETRNPKP